MISRRGILLSVTSLPMMNLHSSFTGSTLTLLEMYVDPLLRDILNRGPRKDCNGEGACGPNRERFQRTEYQRDGTETIISGVVNKNVEWVARGWNIIDWGRSHLIEEVLTLSRGDWFHVTSLFVEALARALIIDPRSASPDRLKSLRIGADYLLKYENIGMQANAPLTHRFFILFSALGQCHTVLGDLKYAISAWRWAEKGLALQAADGVNPELGGFDASYQIVGPLFAMRYYPSLKNSYKRSSLSQMIIKSLDRWVIIVDKIGNINTSDSTRIGKETYNGKIKHLNFYELFQALVFAGRIFSRNDYIKIAIKIRPQVYKALGILK